MSKPGQPGESCKKERSQGLRHLSLASPVDPRNGHSQIILYIVAATSDFFGSE